MLKGLLGKFEDFLLRCEEDVVVLVYIYIWKEQEIKSIKNGDLFYVNMGIWIDFVYDVSEVQFDQIFFIVVFQGFKD